MRSKPLFSEIEWPTMALLATCYGAFGLVTHNWDALPGWLLFALGAYLTALHGGLQHEAIHGHPTGSRGLNELLVLPSILMWVPYRRYRSQHLTHHNNDMLTDPFEDPESFYLAPEQWRRLPAPARWVLVFNNTLLGRVTIGAAINMPRFWWREARLALGGDREVLSDWLMHIPAAGLVLYWTTQICGMPFWVYAVCFAYPGTAFILLRSFAEHRAHKNVPARTLIVETNWLLSVLFLYNNLHSAHHDRPGMAWYRLPKYYAENKARLLAENEGYRFSGYAGLVAAHLLRAKEPVAHPLVSRR